MKYIITDYNRIVIGSGSFHADLARGIPGEVVSAGHMRIKNGKVEVYGRSEGYGIEAKPEDAELLQKALLANHNER